MNKKKSTLKILLLIAGFAIFLMACGLIDQVMDQIGPAEELVEELIPPDDAPIEEPVIVDEPADIADPGVSDLPAEFALYPRAELFSVTHLDAQTSLHRYLTNDPVEDVLAFFQSEYSYLSFRSEEPCTTWDVADEDAVQFFEELIEIGIHNLLVCHTDGTYFEIAAAFGEGYFAEEDLERLPENLTIIEIAVWEGN